MSGQLDEFSAVLREEGLSESLRFLNSQARHRFTCVRIFEGGAAPSEWVVDKLEVFVRHGGPRPPPSPRGPRVVGPGGTARPAGAGPVRRFSEKPSGPVLAHCGVLIREPGLWPGGEGGRTVGTLGHYDFTVLAPLASERALLEAAAPLVFRSLATG